MNSAERERIIEALNLWTTTKAEQEAHSKAAGRAQGGTRAAVTGGKHLAGVNQLILDELDLMGLDDITCLTDTAATLPGYYRARKAWDLLVFSKEVPVLVVEYKSMKGSEGNNLNNRFDEVLGVAEDLRMAQARGLVNPGLQRAYIFIMEVNERVTKPVKVTVAAGVPDPLFVGASYLDRMGIMCERLLAEGLYDLTWCVGVPADPAQFVQPNPKTDWYHFVTGLRRIFVENPV